MRVFRIAILMCMAVVPACNNGDGPSNSRSLSPHVQYNVQDVRSTSFEDILSGFRSTNAISYSDDGRLLLASDNRLARVYDSVTLKTVAEIEVTDDPSFYTTPEDFPEKIRNSQMRPDGEVFLTAHGGGKVKLWNARNGRPICTIQANEIGPSASEFSADNSRILTAFKNVSMQIWSADDCEFIRTIETPDADITPPKFSPNARSILIHQKDKSVKIFHENNVVEIADAEDPSIWATEFSPDGSLILTLSKGGSVLLWDANTGELLSELFRGSEPVFYGDFSPDSQKVVANAGDVLTIWDTKSYAPLFETKDPHLRAQSANFSPDGTMLAINYWSRSVVLWIPERDFYWNTSELVGKRPGPRMYMNCNNSSVRFRPDGLQMTGTCGVTQPVVWSIDLSEEDSPPER